MALGLIPNPAIIGWKELYESARAYLIRSAFAREVITTLDSAPEHVGILVDTEEQSQFVPPFYQRCPRYLNGGLIIWDPGATVNTFDLSRRNPLAHGGPSRPSVPWTRERTWYGRALELLLGPRTRTGHLSSAMLLLHEMGHALQYLSDPAGFQTLLQNSLLQIENINVTAIEATVAHELRALGANETPRWHYMHQQMDPGSDAWPNWQNWIRS